MNPLSFQCFFYCCCCCWFFSILSLSLLFLSVFLQSPSPASTPLLVNRVYAVKVWHTNLTRISRKRKKTQVETTHIHSPERKTLHFIRCLISLTSTNKFFFRLVASPFVVLTFFHSSQFTYFFMCFFFYICSHFYCESCCYEREEEKNL